MSIGLETQKTGENHDGNRDAGIQITITVNGPGEVACWLSPLLPVLRRQLPQARICVALLPCVFSTGAEFGSIRSRPEVDAVLTPKETLSLVLKNRIPTFLKKKVPGFVLHLGGDQVLTWLMSRRLGQPCLAYLERKPTYSGMFAKVFYSGFSPIKIRRKNTKEQVIGDMMVDAAWMRCAERTPFPGGPITVGLYPGSRDHIARLVLPFFAAVCEHTAVSRPDLQWMMVKSDFLTWDCLRSLREVDDGRPIEGVGLTFREADEEPVLITPKGIRIQVMKPGPASARIGMAVTLPGSNTAELSAQGIPMVVTIPSWQAELIPWPGLAGHIGRIPLVGKYLKRLAGRIIYRRIGYAAHPNRRAGRMVVPELVGHIRVFEVSAKLLEMLDSDLGPMAREIQEIMGKRGASQRLVSELIAFLTEQKKSDEGRSTS